MASGGVSKELVLITPGVIVGPGSEFERQRIALRTEAEPLIAEAQKIKVTSPETAEKATQAGRVLQVCQKERENFFKNVKTQIDAVKKPVLEAEKADIGAIEAEKTRLGRELTVYNDEQRRIREEIERKAREEAERVAREEALNRAIELEAAGEMEQAEAVLEEPTFVPVVIQATAPPKAQGQVGKLAYAMEVVDLMALVKAVAAGIVPLQAIVANESYLNSKARLEKEAYQVPGTRLVKKESTHFRS